MKLLLRIALIFTFFTLTVQETSANINSLYYHDKISSSSSILTRNNLLTLSGTISGPVAVCLNQTNANVTFTGSGGTAPYTFTYIIGTGASTTIVTTIGNSVTLPIVTSTAGSITYTLVSVHDSVAPTVEIAQTDTYTVLVKVLPNANAGANKIICDNSSTTIGGTTVTGSAYSWTASPADASLTTSSSSAPSVSPNVTTVYTLTETNNGCSYSNSVTVTVKALPVVNFIFTNNQCSGSSVAFNSTATGTGPFTYAWTFGDGGTSTSSDPSHVFNAITGNGTQNFSVTLSVTNTITNCEKSITKTVSVKQKPDASLFTNGDGTNATFFDISQGIFVNCGATSSSPQFEFIALNSSSTASSNTSYTIDWGDNTGISNYTSSFTSANHLYNSLGFFNIIITAINSTTVCSTSKTYRFFNGNTPSGNLANIGNTTDCVPYTVIWPVENTTDNTPGTTYIFSINDGSPPQSFTQSTLPASISHTFLQSSCGLGLPSNKFTVTFKVTNPCGETEPTTQIQTTLKPVASYTISPSTNNHCTNSNITFTNTSIGNYVPSGSTCSTNFNKTWTVTPSTGWTLSSGALSGPGTDVIVFNFNTPGNYSISLNIRRPGAAVSRCTDDTKTQTICIAAPLLPLFTLNKTESCTPAVITTTNTTDITNSCNPPTYLWDVQYASGYCGSTPPTWSYTSGSATTANPSFSFVTPGTYSIKVTMTNSCGAVTSAIQNVIVKKPSTVNINAIPNLCQTAGNTTISPTAVVNGCAPTTSALTYSWSFSGGIPATSNSAIPGAVNFALPGSHTVTLSVMNECGTTQDSTTFSINPLPTISGTLFACAGSTSQLIGSATPAITTPWVSSAPTIASVSNSGLVTGITAGTATITYTNNNGCLITALFTVNPLGQVTLPANQVVCVGSSTTSITFATTNTVGASTYAWTNNNTAIGLVVSGNGNIPAFTTTNTGTSPITGGVTVTPTLTNGTVNCPGPSVTFTITVNPTAQVIQPTNAVFCAGTATSATIPFSTLNTGGTTTYNWTIDTTTIGLPASGSGSIPVFTPINNSTAPITATVTVTPSFSNGGTACTGTSKTFIITINPRGQVNTISNQIICNGGSTAAVAFSTTIIGTTSYSWTNTNSGIGIGLTGIGDIPTFVGNNSSNSPTLGNFVVTPTFTNASVSCPGPTQTFSITVNPAPQVNTISNQIVCHSGLTTLVNFTTTNIGSGTVSYNWTNDTPSIGLAASGSGNIAGFSASNTGTAPIIAIITVTPSYTNGTVTCTGTAKTFTITVNPKGQANIISNQTVCNGLSTNAINFGTSNTGGTTTYSWTNNLTSIGLSGSGSGNIAAFNATNNTALPVTATITVTPTFANGTPTCSGAQQQFTITVNPSPAVTFTPTNQSICSGDSSALVTLGSATAGATYSWTAFQPTGITGVTTTGTSTIPVQMLTNSTNAPITITYSATATIAGGATCAGAVYTYTITVKPRPAITEVFAANTCSGSGFTVTPLASALNSIPTGTTYSWPIPAVIGGLTGGALGAGQSAITGTLNNPTNTSQTAIYTVTPSSNGCSGTAFTVTVTVNPKPVIAGVTPAAICSGTSFSVTPSNSGATIVPSGTTYTWTVGVNTNITGQSASSATGITTISQTLINGVNTPQSLIYTVTPTSGDTGNCVGTPFTITVTVSPKPTIADVTPAAICSGTSFSVTPSNSGATIVPTGTTYTWTAPVSTPSGAITGGSTQPTGQSSIGQLLSNGTSSVGTLDYTVTPSSGSCQGTPFHIIVTVNPIPGTLSLTNLSYCNGVLTAPIIFSNAVTGTTYAWTNSNPLIGLTPVSGVGDVPAFTATNVGATAITSTLSVIATANGCSRVAETFTITVNPSPAVTFTPTNQSICSGDSSALVTLGSATAGATYSWTAVQPTGITGVATTGTSTIPVQMLTNSTNAPITITYSATATIAGGATCAGAVYTYTITVKPRPAIENQSIVICNNQNFTFNPVNSIPTTSTIVPLGTVYTWSTSVNSSISGQSAGSGLLISQTLSNSSNSVQTIDYNVIPTYLDCPGNPFVITITVNPTPTVQFSNINQIICNNAQSLPITLSSNAAGIINYSWSCINPPLGINGIISSGTNSIPIQTLENTTANPILITYTAYAEIAGSVTCQGPPSTYTITVNPTIITSSILTNYNSYNVSYFGGTDGAIDLTVSGGSGIYTYSWTGPNSFISTSQDISNLVAGNYTVSINDGYCNPVILNFILTQPPELLIQETIAAHYNLLCFGDSNGTLGVTITQESVAPYDYQLLNSSGVVISFINNTNSLSHVFNTISAGIFSIKVIDGNGGVKTISGLTLSQPNDIVITAATTPITCYGGNNASIILTVTGGTLPYTGIWDNLATGLSQNNLSAGTYTIVITDANNCSKPITVIIPEAPIFTVNPIVANISCFGANDGSINLNFIGGILPVVLTWSDGSTAGTTRNNLGPGTYSVIIRDSKPCYINRTFIIVEPQLLVLASNITNALDCNNANSGSINLMVSGGNPPFTYSWSNGATTEDLINVGAGNYLVSVIDSKGCTKSAQYVISRPPPIVLGVQTNTVFDCVTKSVKQTFVAQASGGVPSYIYNWSSGTISGPNNETMDTATNGMILLQATDAIGCSTNYTFNVDIPTLGTISFNSNSYAYATYGSYSINDPIQFTNIASGDFISVNWSFGDGVYSTELNPIHQYVSTGTYIITQTVTYPFGCVYNNVTSMIIGEGYALVIPNAFTPNNDALNAFFQPEYKGLSDFTLDVYDTWGELIYSEKGDAIRGWDGKVKGQDSENGNYYYKVSGITFYGKIIEKQASFVLIK